MPEKPQHKGAEEMHLPDPATALERELQALEMLSQIRRQIHETHGAYAGDPVAEAREERMQDMREFGAIRNERCC
ncbi:MAG: hypothetical protein JW934_10030 [Anaerolineae bacterium]|nr:hypothetical protein [Anaerolineae bacterium]